jgi:hypothetical protein
MAPFRQKKKEVGCTADYSARSAIPPAMARQRMPWLAVMAMAAPVLKVGVRYVVEGAVPDAEAGAEAGRVWLLRV